MLSLAAAQDQNVRFQKPAQNEPFYRLSCRAGFSNPKHTNIKKAAGFGTGGWKFF
jgi:hypothetical protein